MCLCSEFYDSNNFDIQIVLNQKGSNMEAACHRRAPNFNTNFNSDPRTPVYLYH